MRAGRFADLLVLGVLALGPGAATAAQEAPVPPSPARWVTDEAGFLSGAVRDSLDARLESFERSSGAQVLVYIGRTTGGAPIEDWAARAFKDWRVGRRGLDDGLVLFIMAEDRRARIEVGYGLEAKVPDIIAGRILGDVLIPGIRAGDNDAAVEGAVAAIMDAVAGPREPEAAGAGRSGVRSRPISPFEKLLIIAAVIGFLILLITNPSFALWLLFTILSGGRGGGVGGGGFRGGGGRSGGGGASGSW